MGLVEFNGILQFRSTKGKDLKTVFGYYEKVPVIVNPNPLVVYSYAGYTENFPYGDQLELYNGWFIMISKNDLKTEHLDTIIAHEYGHVKKKHISGKLLKDSLAKSLWRVKGVRYGRVHPHELEADIISTEIVGLDKTISGLEFTLKRLDRLWNTKKSERVPSTHMKMDQRERVKRLSRDLSIKEIELRIQYLKEYSKGTEIKSFG